MACWREVSMDSSTRFTIRTGRPAFRATAIVTGSMRVYDFDPKPPPRNGTMIRTRSSGTPNTDAISARTRKGCWQLAQRVMSSPSTWAMQACVSIAYW
jgi:hypothetical protein